MVLGRATEHARTADVDVLDGIVQGGAWLGNGLPKRVEVDDHQVNRRDAVLCHGGFVRGVTADVQQTAVHFGMQSFDAAVQYFRKTGVFTDVFDR